MRSLLPTTLDLWTPTAELWTVTSLSLDTSPEHIETNIKLDNFK